MKTMNLIGEQTYLVVDEPSNRFNFFGLIEVEQEMVEDVESDDFAINSEVLPDDVRRSLDVMAENGAELASFTDVVRFEKGEDTFYLLAW